MLQWEPKRELKKVVLKKIDTFAEIEVLTAVVKKSPIFWDITPYSPLKGIRDFGEHVSSRLFSACFVLVSCLTYSATLKMEAACTSETSVDILLNTRHYILEDRPVQCNLIPPSCNRPIVFLLAKLQFSDRLSAVSHRISLSKYGRI
jgi:hypothetical protein